MKTISRASWAGWLLVLALPAGAGPEGAREHAGLMLGFEIFRVRGEVLGVIHSLADTRPPGPPQQPEGMQLFERAELSIGGLRLEATGDGWSWSGQPRPPEGSRVEIIAAPHVGLRTPDRFGVTVRSNGGVEYFARRPDGLFELKRSPDPTGMSLVSNVEIDSGGRVRLRDLQLGLDLVEARQPIEGVALDVGAPLIRHIEYDLDLLLAAGRSYGLLIPTSGNGFILVRLQATVH